MITQRSRNTSCFSKCRHVLAIGLLLVSSLSFGEATPPAHEEAATHGSETAQLHSFVKALVDDNAAFVKSHKPEYFKPFADKQHPWATVVTCSDSRVHTHALHRTPDGDLFMVRNIGNQISTAEGSVEYGVHHLHTPLLIIVGHVACGAIKAAMGDFGNESDPIRNELSTISLPPRNEANNENQEWLRGVDANVNNQVDVAMQKFSEEVKSGRLTVIGSIYDFQNAFHQGYGKLVITNINGNHDTANVLAGIGSLTTAGGEEKKTPAHREKSTVKSEVQQKEFDSKKRMEHAEPTTNWGK